MNKVDVKKLREKMDDNGIKHLYIAEKLGCSKSHLSKILAGQRGTEEFLKRLQEIIEEEIS